MQETEYITDEQVVQRAKAAVKIAIEKKKAMGIPVAIYDSKTSTIYQIDSNGNKKAIAKISGGRYSERCKANGTVEAY